MKPISCFVIDDEKGPRERLTILLSKMDNIKILGMEGNPEQAINTIFDRKPDIVFVDMEMPRMSGFDLVKRVRKIRPAQEFIFVTAFHQYAIKALKNEAFDYLLKPVDIDELHETLNRFKLRLFSVHKKTTCTEPEILKCFSERELEILKLIATHKTAREIAEELCLSKHTVDTHRKNILEKAGLHRTTELVVFALENGLGE